LITVTLQHPPPPPPYRKLCKMASPVRIVSTPMCSPEVLHRNMCVHRATYDAEDFTRDAFKKFASVIHAAKRVTGVDPVQGTFLLPQPFATGLRHRERYDLTPSNKKDLFLLRSADSTGDVKNEVLRRVGDELSSFGDENSVVEVCDNGDAIEVLAVVVLPCRECAACSSNGCSSERAHDAGTSGDRVHSMRIAITLIIERQDPHGFSCGSSSSSGVNRVQKSAGDAWISRWEYTIKIFSVLRCTIVPRQGGEGGCPVDLAVHRSCSHIRDVNEEPESGRQR
jgi:hypothetical protein